MQDHGATVYDWLQVVRRIRLGRTVKGITAILASYADPDGTRVFPGIAGLAVAAEVDYKTAQAALAKLRRVGLIERVAKSGRRGISDEYRLIIGEGLLDEVEILDPTEFRQAADRMRRRRGNTASPQPRQPESPLRQPSARDDVPEETPTSPVDNQGHVTPPDGLTPVDKPGQPGTHVSPRHIARQPTPAPNVSPRRGPPPSIDHPLPTNHDQPVARTDLTVVGHPQTAGTAPTRASPRCPHGRTTRRRNDGTPRCPDCHTNTGAAA